jgi:pimeloyl-ACP methyl ester carboxylesterase
MELTLTDGSVLSFEEYGDPRGVPVYFFHGLPSCRLEASAASEAAMRAGVRLVAVDRPGFGRSSFRRYQPLVRFSDAIAELSGDLDTPRFAVVGVSAGGPFALATAVALHDRVSAAATVGGFFLPAKSASIAGMNPELRASLHVARLAPWLVRPLFAVTVRAVKRKNTRFVEALSRRSPGPDRDLLQDTRVRSEVLRVLREAFAQGAAGAAWEQRLLVRDWGFALDTLKVPVTVWQGGRDRNVPAEVGRLLASAAAGARLELVPDEGHLSLVHNRMEDVLRDLTKRV